MAKTQKITVRITPDISKALDDLAEQRHLTRSIIVRNLLTNCQACYSLLEAEWQVDKPELVELEGSLSEEVVDNLPDEYANRTTLLLLSRILRKAAEAMKEGGERVK